jgi:hypothetical protein
VHCVVYGPGNFCLGHLIHTLKRRGHRVSHRADRGAYQLGQGEPNGVDLAVTDGVRPPMDLMIQEYATKKIPVLVTDMGYVRRDLGYHQLGLGGLGWLPRGPCSPDRWDELSVDLVAPGGGDYVLITGQKPLDGSHYMSEAGLANMYQAWVDKIRRFTDRQIVFRPHPRAPDMRIQGAELDVPTDTKNGGLAEAIAGAWAVITFNSTSGTDALLAGVPVFCRPGAQYSRLANTHLTPRLGGWLADIEEPFFPDRAQLLDHFHRLAYAQWTVEEMKAGTGLDYVLENLEDF